VARARPRAHDTVPTNAADHASNAASVQRRDVAASDIARRAHELYVARGCEDGHDVDDWLQAERDVRRLLSAVDEWA
jgi:hypothetical protein